jgi:EAL domain-containing protein (putative c-di-GMP-specific phosphodiesterase class I)
VDPAATTGDERTRAEAAAGWDLAVERVLRTEEVRLALQPIIDLQGATVAGHEVLARLSGGPSERPDLWFAAAHARGVGDELEALVLRRALDLAKPGNTFLTVNLSPSALCSAEVAAVVDQAGSLEAVIVEVTEHDPIAVGELRTALDDVRDRGGLVAVDDAGSGYAGLQLLLDIEPDLVKLDRALVAGIDRDPIRAGLAALLGDLTGRMDAWLLAEGIETDAELEAVVRLGVPLGQGYRLGRPAPGWSRLDEDLQLRLTAMRAGADSVDDLRALVRPNRWRPAVDRAEAAGELEGRDDLDHVVLVDQRFRAVELLVRVPGGVAGHPPLVVKATEPIHDVGRRVVLRPADRRWDPIICTDPLGRYAGIIPIEALLDRLCVERKRSS